MRVSFILSIVVVVLFAGCIGWSLGDQSLLNSPRRRLLLDEEKHYLVVLSANKRYGDVSSISPRPSESFASVGGAGVAEDVQLEGELLSNGSILRMKFKSQDALDRVNDDPNVLSVEEDGMAYAVGGEEAGEQKSAKYFLDYIDSEIDQTYSYDLNGEGVNVYVLDTGIRRTHSEFEGRAIFGADFTDKYYDQTTNNDIHGHGTHCAGTVGGLMYGAAKKVTLIDVQVLGDDGTSPWSYVIQGIEYAMNDIKFTKKKALLSISISGGYNYAVNQAIKLAYDNNILVVVAAGNDSGDACNNSPASSPHAVTVGAFGLNHEAGWFTNWGKCVDILAPGVSVYSASNLDDSSFTYKSGTSMATPLVAGAFAMLMQKKTQGQEHEKTQRDTD